MRHDNVVEGLRSISSHASTLIRARLINTPRRAAAFGLAAAIGTGALLMSTTHESAANAEMAKAAVVQQAAERSATTTTTSKKSTSTRSKARAAKAATTVKKSSKTIKARLTSNPVAGLDATQMSNAIAIVQAGAELGVGKKAQIVAVATAMQESNLYNRASYVVPESLKYDHEGYGADYDSVGLFQQRYTTGWGTVKSIMNPSESAKKFYNALMQIEGWQSMPLTRAAQTVQGSAFPGAYAKHQGNATAVVTAIRNTLG
jgi:hypothetical protein